MQQLLFDEQDHLRFRRVRNDKKRSRSEKRRLRQKHKRKMRRMERRQCRDVGSADCELDELETAQEVSWYLYCARHGLPFGPLPTKEPEQENRCGLAKHDAQDKEPCSRITETNDCCGQDNSHEQSHREVIRPNARVRASISDIGEKESKRYVVHSLIAGDGVLLHRGTIYASSKKYPEPGDCWKTFMDPSLDTDLFKGYGAREVVFPAKYIERKNRPVRAGVPRELRVSRNDKLGKKERLTEILQSVKRYLLDPKNAGVCVRITKNGSRAYNSRIATQHLFQFGRTFVTKGIFNCGEASYINAVWLLRGEEVALKVALAVHRNGKEGVFDKLSQLGAFMHQCQWHHHKCELRVVKLPATSDVFEWMVSAESSVYLVRLEDKEGSNHTICLDIRENKKAIWDNEETFPVRLNARNIQLCGGASSRIKEIRRVNALPI